MSNDLSRGIGRDSDSLLRRIVSLESFLKPFTRKSLIATLPQGGAQSMDVLAIGGGTVDSVVEIPVEPFAGIVKYKRGNATVSAIEGGLVEGGPKQFTMNRYDLNLSVDGVWRVYLEIGLKANVADKVLLPGLETIRRPVWQITKGDYPDKKMPTAPDGDGKMICAVGTLTIEKGVPTLRATGRGGFYLYFRPGTLGHSIR